jgi:hypothetical protein
LDRTTTRVGELLHNWRQIVFAKENASTVFLDEKWELNEYMSPEFYIRYTGYGEQEQYFYGRNVSWYGHDFKADHSLGLPTVGLAQNRGLAKAWDKLGSHFEGLTALGELRETVRGIRHPAQALRKGLDDYLNGARKVRRAIRKSSKIPRKHKRDAYIDAVSGSWLEYSYGWAPLLNDIEDGFAAFRERMGAPAVQRFRAVGHADLKANWKQTGIGIWYSYSTRHSNPHFTTYVIYQGAAKSLLTSDASVLESLGVYPAAFIPTAWELTPWSMVIDYFTNVGDVLNAYALCTRVGFQWVNKTTVRECDNWVMFLPGVVEGSKPWITDFTFRTGLARIQRKLVSRISNLPELSLPSFQTDMQLSWRRDVNLAGLLAQQANDWGWKGRSLF